MADYRNILDRDALVSISEDFDYIRATDSFVGLKLFPMAKTEDLRVSIANLVDGADVPVMAFVHALDTEARVGNRPNFSEIKVELLLIKEKLNQGEALTKKLGSAMRYLPERNILEQVYNDVANLISRVLTRMEVMACELLSTGAVTVNENGVTATIDYGYSTTHNIAVTGWSDPAHDIIGDIASAINASNGKIKRALVPVAIMRYMIANTAIGNVLAKQGRFATEESVKTVLAAELGVEFVVTKGTYKQDPNSATEYYFFKQDVITFLTTDEAVGRTFVTDAPEVDLGVATASDGFVSVTQYRTEDPAALWTKASAVAVPVPKNINELYLCTVTA